jgi:hypothetical protein
VEGEEGVGRGGERARAYQYIIPEEGSILKSIPRIQLQNRGHVPLRFIKHVL